MERKRIGLFFIYGKEWMGGVIYILNLIRSLDTLPENEKPHIVLLYTNKSESFLNDIEYRYITKVKVDLPSINKGFLISKLIRKNIFAEPLFTQHTLDGLFPLEFFPVGLGANSDKAVSWIPDLQHIDYPEYFSKKNRFTRHYKIQQILKNSSQLVLSSNSVYMHLKQHFKFKATLNVHIMRFTSIIDAGALPDFEAVKKKFEITTPYFMVSNQFWKHKDHLTVFRAIRKLKDSGKSCMVVFSGNMEDKRSNDYISWLKNELDSLNISDSIKMVGLISRQDQLSLMKNSMAVVQPSLFEGWSTVIEDAKALRVQLIASDLDVHLEQLDNGDKGYIFKRQSVDSLADIMTNFIEGIAENKPVFDNYEELTKEYGKKFLSIFKA